MRKNDYVLLGGLAWQVLRKHKDGTFQIKNLTPKVNHIDNMQVSADQCTLITKEVADIIRSV
jgi:hypothetical protein